MKHLLKKNKITIRGAGGGSMPSGGTSAPPPPPAPVAVQMYPSVLAPPLMGQTNYISSFSYAEIVDLISDGPIEGLVNQDNKKVYGADIFEGIFLNGVPVKETSRINSEELDIGFLKQELKNFWRINEGDEQKILSKKIPYVKAISEPTNNPFFTGPITLTSYHPEDSLFQLIKSLNLDLDSIKLAQRAFDAISVNDERPFLTIINIPTFTVPIADFKFDKSLFANTSGFGLDLEITNIGQYIYFTVDSENLNSNQYSEIPRTFIKYASYASATTLKNNIAPLSGYSAQKFNGINIYIWSVYDQKNGIKDISKAVDRYLNKITIRQRLPGQYNYNLIKSEFKNGAEVQYPLQNFKNVEIDIQHDKELIGPFKILNNQYVNSARCSAGGGVIRLTDLNSVAQNAPVTSSLDSESSDDVRYVQNWPIEYDAEGKPLIISNVVFNYGVFDQTSKNRVEQPAIPVTHYIDNNNVEQVYVGLTLNSLSDTNHIDLVSENFGTKPNYTEDPYEGTLTYAQLIQQNVILNAPAKVSTRYIAGVNISSFIPWSTIFPLGIQKPNNINEAQYPFVEKFAEDVSKRAIEKGESTYPTVVWLFGVNLNYLANTINLKNDTIISIENLNVLLEKYYLYSNINFQTLLSTFAGGKLIGYSKLVGSANTYKAYDFTQAKASLPFKQTDAYNVFTSSAATTFGNGIYLTSDLYKATSNNDYVFEYQITPKEVNRGLNLLPSRTTTDIGAYVFNRKQQITAGTRLPAVVSIRIDTGYETNENSNYAGSADFFSYKFDIYGLASDASKIDIGRRGYDFVRGQTIATSTRGSMYAAAVADSSLQFHLFKITESGKTPNYYISNTRNIQYECVDFSSLNPTSFVFKNASPDLTGLIPVYYTGFQDISGEIESYFSGYITGIILNKSSDYICEICTLNECGLFGLQTSGYLSLENFEKDIVIDGALKIPEVLKNSIFDNYKLNMSTALPELKKINYLNFPAVASPYNFIECSSSLDPLNNCYGIDTYKFNSYGTNTCVQVCSFNVEMFNTFADNLKVATPKSSYSFSIFRVNGDISLTQAALNNLAYKYVVLNIGAIYQNYILVYLPDGKNTASNVYEVMGKIGLPRSSYNPLTQSKIYVYGRNGYNHAKYFELKHGFIEAYHSEMNAWYGEYGTWQLDIQFDLLIKRFAVKNPNDSTDDLRDISIFVDRYNEDNEDFLVPVFLCLETIQEKNTSNYSANYNNFIYSHGSTNIVQNSFPRQDIKTTNSNVSLNAYSSHNGTYFQTSWDQDATNLAPSPINSALKSFLFSISNDQNVTDPNILIEKFKKIKWIARSNAASYSSMSYCPSFFTIASTNRIREYSYIDHLCMRSLHVPYLLPNYSTESLEVPESIEDEVTHLNYNLNFEIAASQVFSIPSQPRAEISSPLSTDAISVNAKFWVLDNESTNTLSVIFVEPNKGNCWVDLQDGISIAKLPLTSFLSSYNATFCYVYASSREFGRCCEYATPIPKYYLSSDGSISNTPVKQIYCLSPNYGHWLEWCCNFYYPLWGTNGLVCKCNAPEDVFHGQFSSRGDAVTSPGRADYFDYNFLTNNNVLSLDSNKNLRIISAPKTNEPTLKRINDLLKSSSLLGDRKIPADAFFASYSTSPKVYRRWHNTNTINTITSLPFQNAFLSNYINNPKTQILNIYYYEVALSNFNQKKEGVYANDAGQEILLPPPRVDTSGSPIRRYVKVTKLSYETLSPLISKRISVGAITEIIPQTFSYPFSAIVGTKIDARSFSQMPARSFHCKLKKVLVPSNYYPNNPKDESDIRYDVNQVGLHKIYDGDWDGTFKLMWTDNPAWILMDMLVNKRYGLGNHISPEQIDIWELYQVARWCDGVNDEGVYYGVPDSYGGVEPRHAFNALISEKFNVFDMINQIASVFRGHVYYMNSLITFDDDRPKPPIGEFTNADVKDGLFNYTNLKKDDEFTAIEVAFVDAKNDYRSSIEYIENADAIRKRGILKKQMNAFGVTSRGQARRIGKHFLHQSSKENLNVSFTTDMKALLYKPGDLITIHDELLNSHKNFGSVKAIEEVQNSGDLFKVVIDQALNSGVYDTNIVTLYSATTKPTYSDMQQYLQSGTEYSKITIDFLQPLLSSMQAAGQEIRSRDPHSFGIRNGVTSNQITYGYSVYSPRQYYPVNHPFTSVAARKFNEFDFIPNYLDYLNSGCRYYNYPCAGAFRHLYSSNEQLVRDGGQNTRPIFRIQNEVIIPYADVGFGCLAAPNDYLFPPFLASISGKTIAQPCRVFGKDCLFILMNSGVDYCAYNTVNVKCSCPNYVLSGISYITYPCSDMEIYTSRISGLPVYVETGNKIKNEVILSFPSGNRFELCRSDDFLFTGSIEFKYCTYERIVYVTGRHQLCDYTKPLDPAFEAQHIDLLSKLDINTKSNLGFYSQGQGFAMSTPYSPRSTTSINFKRVDPIKSYGIMSNTDYLIQSDNSIYFSSVYGRYTISGLSKIPQNNKIFFPALMYFCVSENKSSYYIDGIIEKTEHIPINLRYVENDTFINLVSGASFTPKLAAHWSITVGTGFSDILELDWVGNESEKLKSNIYEILNNANCFRFSKLSGIISGEPVYLPPTGFSKVELYPPLATLENPTKFCNYNNIYTRSFCYDCGFYEEPFQERSGTYSGFNNLYLFSQMTGTRFVLNYPKNHIPSEADKDLLPRLVSEPLNETYLSGIRELLCQCFNLGKPYYPVYNTGLCTGTFTTTSLEAISKMIFTGTRQYSGMKLMQNLMLDNFQNFNPRMIVDFTGYNQERDTIKYDYSYFQRTFLFHCTGFVKTGDITPNLKFNGYDSLHSSYYTDSQKTWKLISFSSCFSLCADHFPPFYEKDVFKPLVGGYLSRYLSTDSQILDSDEIQRFDSNPYDSPRFEQASPVVLYMFARCSDGYRSTLRKHAIANEKSISYSKIIENDRPSIETFCVYNYITGYNQSSGFDESISTNTYTEIYLCKTNQFGVTKDSVRNGLTNFCVGSLYSLQILNKTAPTFKIMSITENYINEYNIFATQYKEEKFLEIEENVQVDSLDNTFNALYYYQSASRLTQKNEPLKSPIILSIDYIRYSNAPTLDIKWQPVSEHIEGYTKYRIYVQSPSKQTPNLQVIVGDEGFDKLNNYFKYNYQGDGITNPLIKEIGNYTISVEAFYENDGVYVFSIPAKRSINILNY